MIIQIEFKKFFKMVLDTLNQARSKLIEILRYKLITDQKDAVKLPTKDSVFSFSSLILPPPTSIDKCYSSEDLARLLGYSYNDLAKMIYPSTRRLYRKFNIPKKSGVERTIEAPKKKLKSLQRKIVIELSKYFQPRPSAHGFIKKRSIVSNASPHVNKTFVFNIDLENFFGTIHFGRVKNLFSSYPLKLSHQPATVLAQICCNKGCLPQGAPTSPIISNMVCHKLDRQLQGIAKKYKCTYTRYVDDISFSFTTTKNKLPSEIVYLNSDDEPMVGSLLDKIIDENGFKVNPLKIRIKSRSQKQEVTGLIVNEKTNVKRAFVRQTFSMIHALKKYGPIDAEKHYLEKYRKNKIKARHKKRIGTGSGDFFVKVVKGRVNYIKMVKGENDQVYRKLAYRLTEAFGKPNVKYLMTDRDKICQSVFILENTKEGGQGSAFCLERVGIVTNYHVVPDIDADSNSDVEFFRFNEISKKRKAQFCKIEF